MRGITLVPIGEVDRGWTECVDRCVMETLGLPVTAVPALPFPPEARDPKRGQYLGTVLLEALLPIAQRSGQRVMGLTEGDIFIPMLTFLFGQAQLGGQVALVSLARLRPEFYGFAADGELTWQRLRKEVLHELGHTYGLVHCEDRRCAMSLSHSVVQVDQKDDAYCADCGRRARLTGQRLEAERRKGEA